MMMIKRRKEEDGNGSDVVDSDGFRITFSNYETEFVFRGCFEVW